MVWMMETKMGILARADDRAGDCDAALSSGVVEAIFVLDAPQWGARHIEKNEYLEARSSSAGLSLRIFHAQSNPAG